MLKKVSLNARGLITPAKCDSVLHELSRSGFDLILLQETHAHSKSQADTISRKWHGSCYWSFGRGRSAGVGLLVSLKFQGEISRYIFNSDGRILSVLVLVGSIQFNIVNIYAPNTVSDRVTFFDQLPCAQLLAILIALTIHSIVEMLLIVLALKGLQTAKLPGSDGLPTEFYLALWEDLGDILV